MGSLEFLGYAGVYIDGGSDGQDQAWMSSCLKPTPYLKLPTLGIIHGLEKVHFTKLGFFCQDGAIMFVTLRI